MYDVLGSLLVLFTLQSCILKSNFTLHNYIHELARNLQNYAILTNEFLYIAKFHV